VNAADAPQADANGNPLRRSASGHVSNYDETKVGAYTLPDPLVLLDGSRVADAATWFDRRRPEIAGLYEDHIYGRVPDTAPRANFETIETDAAALEGTAIRRLVRMRLGDAADGPSVELHLYLPSKAGRPVPVLLHMVFFNNPAIPGREEADDSPEAQRRRRFNEAGPIADILARDFGYATFRYTDAQPDNRTTFDHGVIALSRRDAQAGLAPDEWGTITAWAWTASRMLDHLETDPAVDAKRVALVGHSRLGKTALWAGARDPRFALVFASCSGEMGASLARRDYGETIDNVAAGFPWWMAGNFQDFVGRWNDMPVDAHMLFALCAPRPVFVTAGTEDQWADPHGQFLAMVAAGPVYELLGKRDLGTNELPPLDLVLAPGELGFLYHTGGHAITPADWTAFLDFAARHLQPGE
jgi:hypothetical protein